MDITPDSQILGQWQWFKLNATLLYTWLVMAILVVGSWLVTRNLAVEPPLSRWQHGLEVIVSVINDQIRDASQQDPRQYLGFVGTLFLFIATANILSLFPVYMSPAGSLSTTVALALCVFVAVPLYGIQQQGLGGYLRHYIRPSPIMLPFNIISEVSRTLSLALRLFGNIMSTSLLVAVLVAIVPLIFPAIMQAFGVLIGVIQAYVFAILSMVYIASGARRQRALQQHSQSS